MGRECNYTTPILLKFSEYIYRGEVLREIRIARPLITDDDIAAVGDVLRSGYLTHGKVVEEFENKFAEKHNCKYGIAVSNGTVALEIALRCLGVGFGDEVIVPVFTFAATANSALTLGARPIFCDIDPETFNIDTRCVEERISKRTRVIIPVHLFGHPADMDPIIKIARDNNIFVLEDAAQAHGARYKNKPVGCLGDIGIFSFYATKNITSGEGGIILTNDPQKRDFMKIFRDQGQVSKYLHEILGGNYRMTSIQGMLALKQLERLDHINEIRRRNAKLLNDKLSKINWIKTPIEKEWAYHVYHQYVILLKDDAPITRDELINYLRRHGIETAIHYPRPLNEQPLYRKLGYDENCCPVARDISRRILSLPVHPLISEDDINYIVEVLSKI
ncbi:MAG: DegT/DnrJ/EryC1/StrS family aminotransferase [Sulfolobales archaeon]